LEVPKYRYKRKIQNLITPMLDRIIIYFRKIVNLLNKMTRLKATGMLEWEKSELENIFSLLVFGSFVGLPSTPTQITLALLPLMEEDLIHMINKVQLSAGPLSDLFSYLDVS
jgi:hypothetical protein